MNHPWMKRGSLWLAGATLLGAPVAAATDPAATDPAEGEALPESAELASPGLAPAQQLDGLKEAILGGTFWLQARYRYENVDQDGVDGQGRASTLRSRLGYETGNFHGFSGVLEVNDVATVPGGNDRYDDGSGNNPGRGQVLDPTGTVVSQSYLRYSDFMNGDFKLGRQRISLDNERFVGSHDWRQTEQTFDSLSYSASYPSGISAYYAYVDNWNTILAGENEAQDTHLLNVGYTLENIGTLSGYGYRMDMASDDLDRLTYGARFAGAHNAGQFGILYSAELAQQIDTEDNSEDIRETYSHVMLGFEMSGVTAKLGYESLGGRKGGGNRAFQTPMASLHEFNGYADQFLETPGNGLIDTYFHLGYEHGPFAVAGIYHDFDAEAGSSRHGGEIDLVGSYDVTDELTIGVKYADFSADDDNTAGLSDVTKYWVWMAYSI